MVKTEAHLYKTIQVENEILCHDIISSKRELY